MEEIVTEIALQCFLQQTAEQVIVLPTPSREEALAELAV